MDIDLGWVDIGLAAFLLVSVVIGLARGFVFELLSLAGWFAAYFAAWSLTPMVQPRVHFSGLSAEFNHGIAFAGLFIVALIVWSLAARLVRTLIRATPLSPVDRLLGAGFGLVRGLVVMLIVVTVVGISSWSHSAAWQRSQGVVWLNALLQELKPLWLDGSSPRHPSA